MNEQSKGGQVRDLLNGLQEVTFEGCGYCLIAPEDRDDVVSHLNATAAERDRLKELVDAMQSVVNAASIFENVESNADEDHDGMDEMFELFEAVKRYRALASSAAKGEQACRTCLGTGFLPCAVKTVTQLVQGPLCPDCAPERKP